MINFRIVSSPQKEVLNALVVIPHFLPKSPLLSNCQSASVSTDLPILSISPKWNYTVCGL